MFPKYLYSITTLVLLLVLNACIDPFELTLEDGTEEFLVVDGTFTPENRPHELEIYYTNSQIQRRRRPIEGASIRLVDEAGVTENYQELGAGKYQLLGQRISGQAGRTYHVEIDLPNGEKYQSQPAQMPRKISGDRTHIVFSLLDEILTTGTVIQRPSLEVFVDSPLPQDGMDYWLKWEVSTLYSFPEVLCGPIPPPPATCFVSENINPQQVILLNGERFSGERITSLKVSEKRLERTDFEFRGRHYFLVNQQSIPKEAHDYWDKVNRVVNQNGSIFDAPPAGIPGNIFNVNRSEEMVLGYFEMQHTDSLRAFITAGDLMDVYRFPTNVCPGPRVVSNQFVIECCNCQRIENASLIRPEWF